MKPMEKVITKICKLQRLTALIITFIIVINASAGSYEYCGNDQASGGGSCTGTMCNTNSNCDEWYKETYNCFSGGVYCNTGSCTAKNKCTCTPKFCDFVNGQCVCVDDPSRASCNCP
jgi:hypothetical protein